MISPDLIGDWNYSTPLPGCWRILPDGTMWIIGPDGKLMSNKNGIPVQCCIPEKQIELIGKGILVRNTWEIPSVADYKYKYHSDLVEC